MENQKSFLDKIIEEIRFSGNITIQKENNQKENNQKDTNQEDKKENYISQNIYIISPN